VRTALSVVAIGVEVTMMLTIVGLSEGMLADSQKRAPRCGRGHHDPAAGQFAVELSSAPCPEDGGVAEKQPHVAIAVGSMNHPVGGLTLVTGIDLDASRP